MTTPDRGKERLPATPDADYAEYLHNRDKRRLVEQVRGDLGALQDALEARDDEKEKRKRERRGETEEEFATKIEGLLTATGDSLEALFGERESTISIAQLVDSLNIAEAMEDSDISAQELISLLDDDKNAHDQLGLLATEVDDNIKTIDDYTESMGVSTFDNIRSRVNGIVDMVVAKNPALGEKLEQWGFDADHIMQMIMNTIISLFESFSWIIPVKLKNEMAKQRLELEVDTLTGTHREVFFSDVNFYSGKFITNYHKWLNGRSESQVAAEQNGTAAPGRPTLISIIDDATYASTEAPETEPPKSELDKFFGEEKQVEVKSELTAALQYDAERSMKFATNRVVMVTGEEKEYEFVDKEGGDLTIETVERGEATTVNQVKLKLSSGNPTLEQVVNAIKEAEKLGDDKKEETKEVVKDVAYIRLKKT